MGPGPGQIGLHCYRPQRSWAKVMFLQASVILSTGGDSASVHAGIPPPQEQTPPQGPAPLGPDTTPSPLGPDTPLLPGTRHPPEADSGIWSTSDRYASYWNAFLYYVNLFALQRQLYVALYRPRSSSRSR